MSALPGRQRGRRRLALGALLLIVMSLFAVPAFAQDGGPTVLIYPIDRASILQGALFDFRVEVHSEEMPADFAVTINGEPAADFFGASGTEQSWTIGEEADATPVQSLVWRDLTITEAGEYEVAVTADGATTTAVWHVREATPGEAQNVILFIADGASIPLFTATRLVSRGMQQGFYNDHLSFEQFDSLGLLSTSGTNSIITDSANSASAYNTGHKSAVNATGVYADTSEDAYDDPRVETFAEVVKRTRGMAVGIVTNAFMQDATPAAVWGHSRERNTRSRSDFTLSLIGDQEWQFPFQVVEPEIILGGGARYILPNTVDGSSRPDDVDGFAAYEDAGYTVVTTATELDAAVAGGSAPILGVFANDNMNVWLDRNVYTDNVEAGTEQPGLVDMTLAALEVLSQNENGFYLEVEAANVDKQLHPLDFDRAIADSIEFDRTIAATVDWLDAEGMLDDTLIVVTADHAHSFDVYGTVDVNAFNAATDDNGKRDAIRVYADAEFPSYVDEDGDFYPDEWDVPITLAWGKVDNPPFTEDYQVSPVPRTPAIVDENGLTQDNPEDDPNGLALGGNIPNGDPTSVHTLQDVPVWSNGPGSECLSGLHENIEVFYCMAAAIGLDPTAADGVASAAGADVAEGEGDTVEVAGPSSREMELEDQVAELQSQLDDSQAAVDSLQTDLETAQAAAEAAPAEPAEAPAEPAASGVSALVLIIAVVAAAALGAVVARYAFAPKAS